MRFIDRPAEKAGTRGLFVALLILLVWLPIPLGSNRPWSWALLEVWVYLMAAVWLFKYARERVVLTEPFRKARPALILLTLWLGYGILQMIPLPATVVAAVSPHAAVHHQQAQLGPLLAHKQLESNPVARPMPSFPAGFSRDDRMASTADAQPQDTGKVDSAPGLGHSPAASPDSKPEVVDIDKRFADTQPAATTGGYTTRLSLDLSASITAWFKSLAYVLLFALTLLLVNSRKRLKTLAYVLVLSGLGQAVYGSLLLAASGGGVAKGSFINRNHYAAYLALCLAVGIGLLIASMGQGRGAISWRQRLQLIGQSILSAKAPLRIFLAIMVIALVLTHSRMGNTAFFASMLIAATLALFLFRDMPRPVVILITSLIAIDILIIGSWVGLEKVTDRIAQTTLGGEARDEFGVHSFEMWQDYPLFGAGAGSYYSVYPRYMAGDTREGWLVDHAHNDYLELLSEYGLLGLALPASVVILALGSAILAQRKRRDQLVRGIGFAVTMAITAMLIHATVEFNLQIPAYAATFMVIIAMAWLSLHLGTENPH